MLDNLIFDRPLIFFDLETTTEIPNIINVNTDRIVEYCFIKYNPNSTLINRLYGYLNPTISINQESSKIHHITDEKVKDALKFSDIANQLLTFIKNCDLAGFNIKKYDLLVLAAEFKRNSIDFDYSLVRIIDTMIIYHIFNARDLAAAYKFYCNKNLDEKAHDAIEDCQATIEIFNKQISMYFENPCNISDIDDFLFDKDKYVDREQKFEWSPDGKCIFTFGKFKNQSLDFVNNHHSDYLRWILSSDFSENIKDIIRNALYKGIYPIKIKGEKIAEIKD